MQQEKIMKSIKFILAASLLGGSLSIKAEEQKKQVLSKANLIAGAWGSLAALSAVVYLRFLKNNLASVHINCTDGDGDCDGDCDGFTFKFPHPIPAFFWGYVTVYCYQKAKQAQQEAVQ
jgi:hypothetical protein